MSQQIPHLFRLLRSGDNHDLIHLRVGVKNTKGVQQYRLSSEGQKRLVHRSAHPLPPARRRNDDTDGHDGLSPFTSAETPGRRTMSGAGEHMRKDD